MNIEQIASEALQLDPKDRAQLAETIWESLEDPYLEPNSSDAEAINLAKKRDKDIDEGLVKALNHDQLMDRLRKNED